MKYFICEHCGEIKNSRDIDSDLSMGGSAGCLCNFSTNQWNNISNTFESVCFRIIEPFTEIPKYIYRKLKEQSNHILRLEMYTSWKKATS